MITKELFKNFIESYQNFIDGTDRFDQSITGKSYPTILFETDWYEAVGKMLDIFLDSHFTEEGCDLILWWLFEDVNHIIYQKMENNDLFDNKKEIRIDVNDIENLYNYLIKNGYTKS